jgi:hypothetical protein
VHNNNGATYDSHSGGGSAEYYDHVEHSEVRYVAEFEAFWGRLTPKQRKILVANGVEGPVIEFSSVASLDHDAADTPAASYTEDLARRLDKFSDQMVEKFGLQTRTAIPLASFIIHTIEQESISYKAWLFGKVCGVMLNAKNAKLAAAGLAFASNLASLNGLGSMRQYGRKIGVSVEAVSKVKRKWQAELLLDSKAHSKTPEACANYAIAAKEKHWRRQKFTAEKMRELRAALPQAVT